ncbi:MAG: D-alanine--D-alanine ligase [Candidatus Omnitrophota bacterium]
MPRTRNKNYKLSIKENSRICILMGGLSSEREISIKSGTAVYNALIKKYKNTFCLDIHTEDRNNIKKILQSEFISVAFIAMHGRFGEDGKIQSILEELSIPYTGSNVMASRLAMDKHRSKIIFKKHGIPIAPFEFLYSSNIKDFHFEKFNKFPYIVKPARGGSSIGSSIIRDKGQFNKAFEEAFKYDTKIIIEKYIEGRELTVGILQDNPLDIIEIAPRDKFFDFNAKYKDSSTQYIIPAKIPSGVVNNVKELALASHMALGCKSFSRVDIMIDKYYNPFILEVNTIPGLTNHSLLPKAAKEKGIDFDELCVRLLHSSLL